MIAWLLPEQAEFVAAAAERAGVRVVAAGCPREGHTATVASALGVPPADDLRAVLANADADLVLLAAPVDAASLGGGDLRPVVAAAARGLKIATLDPMPASALELAGAGWLTPINGLPPVDAIRFVPLGRLSRAMAGAAGVVETFGSVHAALLRSWCRSEEGTLGARLYSALDLVLSLMGEPETIEAAFVSPMLGRKVYMLPGETLRDLRGTITANLRFSDGRAAALALSDRGGAWEQVVTLLGPGGRLSIGDDGFEWIGADGKVVDESRPAARARRATGADGVAEGLRAMLEGGAPASAPTDAMGVLCLAQAALLSARTGQGESPATIRRMAETG